MLHHMTTLHWKAALHSGDSGDSGDSNAVQNSSGAAVQRDSAA